MKHIKSFKVFESAENVTDKVYNPHTKAYEPLPKGFKIEEIESSDEGTLKMLTTPQGSYMLEWDFDSNALWVDAETPDGKPYDHAYDSTYDFVQALVKGDNKVKHPVHDPNDNFTGFSLDQLYSKEEQERQRELAKKYPNAGGV